MPLPQKYYGDPNEKPQGLRAGFPVYTGWRTEVSEPEKALSSGVYGLRSSMESAAAAGGYAVGADEFGARHQAEAEQLQQEAAQSAPELQRLEDAESPMDYLQLATNVTLQNLPLIATTALSALTGGIGGALLNAPKAGALAGAALPYFGASTGENFAEYSQDPNAGTPAEKGRTALGAGAVQTGLGMLPIAGVASRALKPGLSAAARVGQGALVGGASEAVTETFEELAQKYAHQQFLNPDVELFDEQAMSDYANAAFGGLAVGAPLGGLGGGMGHLAARGGAAPAPVHVPLDDTGDVSAAEGFDLLHYADLVDELGVENSDTARLQAVTGFLAAAKRNPESVTRRDMEGLKRVITGFDTETPVGRRSAKAAVDALIEYTKASGVDPDSVLSILRRDDSAESLGLGDSITDAQPELDEEGNLVEDPTDESTRFDDQLNEQVPETEPEYLYNERTGMPYVGRHLNPQFSGASKRVAELGGRPGPYRYSEVSLREAVEHDAQRELDPAAYVRQKARGLAKAKKEYRHLYDDNDPAAFLDNFTVVKKEAYAPDARRVEPTTLLGEDLHQPMPAETARLVQRLRKEGKEAEARKLEVSHEGAQIARFSNRAWRGMKAFPVMLEHEKGEMKPAQISAINLTKRMMEKNKAVGEDLPLKDRVARNFFEGLTSLMTMPDRKIKFLSRIPDSLVVFRTRDGEEIRFGEIKTVGWRSLEAKDAAMRQEHAKLLDEVAQDKKLLAIPEDRRGARDNRKNETIRKDIAANERRLKELERQHEQVFSMLEQADRTPKKPEKPTKAGKEEYGSEAETTAGEGLESVPVSSVPKEPITKRDARGYVESGITEERFEENRGPDEEKEYGQSEYIPAEWKRPGRARKLLRSLQYLDEKNPQHVARARQLANQLLRIKKPLSISQLRYVAEQVAARRRSPENIANTLVKQVLAELDSTPAEVKQTATARGSLIETLTQDAKGSDVPVVRGEHMTASQKDALAAITRKIRGAEKKVKALEESGAKEEVLRKARTALEELQEEWSAFVRKAGRQAKGEDVSPALHYGIPLEYAENDRIFDAHLIQKAQEISDQWAKQLRMAGKAKVIGLADAIALTRKRGLDDRLRQLEAGTLLGFSTIEQGQLVVFVHPGTEHNEQLWMETLAHEFGHTVFKMEAMFATDAQAKAVFNAYIRWKEGLNQTTKLEDIVTSKKLPQTLATYLDAFDGKRFEGLPEKTQEYLLDFEEWFADQAAAWLLTDRKPMSVVERFFASVAAKIKQLFGLLEPNGAVEQFMEQMTQRTGEYVFRDRSAWRTVQDLVTAEVPGNEQQEALQKAVDKLSSVHSRIERLKGQDLERVLWASYLTQINRIGNATNELLGQALPLLLKPAEMRILGRAAIAPHVRDQLVKLLKNSPAALESLAYPDEAVGYMYQFWNLGVLNVGPETKTVLGRIKTVLAKVFGRVRTGEQAEALLQALKDGDVNLRVDGHEIVQLPQNTNETLVQKGVQKAIDAWENHGAWFRAGFFPAVSRVYRTHNPALVWMMEQFFARTGRTGVKKTFFEARREQFGRFDNMISDYIFHGKDEAHGKAVLEVFHNPDLMKTADPEVQDTVRRVRKFVFEDIRKYLLEAGVELGDRGENYFPWVFDQDYLMEHADEFKELLRRPQFQQHIEKLRGHFEQREVDRLIRAAASAAAATGEKLTEELTQKIIEDAKRQWAATDMVEYLYSQVAANGGYADAEPIDTSRTGHNPSFRFMNHRGLWFLQDEKTAQPEDRKVLAKFFSKELGGTLRTYVEQATKRAEYVRRFGPNGEILHEQLEKAKQYGATEKDMATTKGIVDAMLGTAGHETNRKLARLFGLKEPPPGEMINPKLNRVMGGMLVYQNLRLLGLATLSSFIDPIGIAVRTGDLRMAFKSFKEGIQAAYHMVKGNPQELKDLGELLGTIDRHMTNEALGAQYGGLYLTGWERKLNEGMFKWNGLQAWAQTTRLMALAAARHFLAKHAKRPNKHSERYFAELGLTPADLRYNDRGEVKVLSYQARQQAGAEELARDDRVRNALNRFVDEAILRPDAAQRPVWASDPHFMLFWHLKSYMYSFHERILRRVAHELGHGNLLPLLYLGWYLPVMLAADLLRDLIQYGAGGNPRKASWTTADYLENAAERSGLLGTPQMLFDVGQDREFGGVGFESMAGPTAQQLKNLLSGSASFESLFPAQNVWKGWNDD